jgi:5-methylcytosine-specific restriction endonuclease McrA
LGGHPTPAACHNVKVKRTPLRRKSNPERAARRSAWRAAVMARDKDTCRLCGRRGTHAHHILYRSQGGPDELWNGIALCWSDHDRVHAGGGKTWRPRLYAITGGPPEGEGPPLVREA